MTAMPSLCGRASAIVGITKAESPSLREASTDWEGKQSTGCDRGKMKVPVNQLHPERNDLTARGHWMIGKNSLHRGKTHRPTFLMRSSDRTSC